MARFVDPLSEDAKTIKLVFLSSAISSRTYEHNFLPSPSRARFGIGSVWNH